MAAQGERECLGVVVMCSVLDPMVQDTPVQDIPTAVEEEQFFPPQMDPEPEMGAAAAEAAGYDTSPPLPHQNPPPIPAETARPSTLDMAQLFAMLAGISGDMQGLQAGIKAISCSETRTASEKMAPPRAPTNELGGECTGG